MNIQRRLPPWLSLSRLSAIQGCYFFIGGVWPLIDMRSFLRITGPKTDLWLVNTVGLLLAVIGVVLGAAGVRGQIPLEIRCLGIGSAMVLASVEVMYVLNGTISAVYLLDALLEAGFVGLWIVLILDPRRNGAFQRD